MTSVFAYVLAVLLVPVALSLMLFVMALIERVPTSAPKVMPLAPVEGPTAVGIDGETNPHVAANTSSAA